MDGWMQDTEDAINRLIERVDAIEEILLLHGLASRVEKKGADLAEIVYGHRPTQVVPRRTV